ncbi:tetratricopeptide repeat protein [Nonomuraea insulae]|uniref:Tetratricopeptide repeat protein n=1 Tax=Nonomuraea insulae TaxID=1616787 RepID=A0ABW1CMJ7_9ACTN
MDTQIDDLVKRAGEAFAAADFQAGYLLALEGLRANPEHPSLLSIAGRSSLELGLGDAGHFLNRLVDQTPDDAVAWRDLAMALLGSAETTAAERALRTALRLDPGEPAARVNLGHVAYLNGSVEEAERLLWETAALVPGDVEALRSLIDMHRLNGRSQAALEAATELVSRAPDDVPARLDVAELQLALGNGAEALAEYRMLRKLDTEPGHAGYLVHAMVEVEIRRERWRRALDLVITATTIDRHRLTTDLLAFVSSRLFGEGERSAPAYSELKLRLEERRTIHRRIHAETRLQERSES